MIPPNQNACKATHTQLNTPPSKPESGQDHLAQSKGGAKDGEEADGEHSDKIEKDDDQGRINEPHAEQRLSQDPNGERGDHHICSQPLVLFALELEIT